MRALPKTLYFIFFVALALTAALAINRVVEPSIAGLLVRAALSAVIAATPGLIYRKAWPLTIILLPLSAYLFLRTTIPLDVDVEGISGQYHFYIEALRTGGEAYVAKFFPLDVMNQPELRLVIGFSVLLLVGVASFVGMGLRRPLPAVAVLLVLVGFGLTIDADVRSVGTALTFLILSACLLVLSRGLKRTGWRLRDGLVGGVVGAVAALLALALLMTTPSAVAQPWKDWRAWDPFRQGGTIYTFDWLQNYPRLLDPGNDVPIMSVQSDSPSYWRANGLDTFTGSAWVMSQVFFGRLDLTRSDGEYSFSVPGYAPTPPGIKVGQVFTLRSVYTTYLFVGGDPISVTLPANAALSINDMRALHVSKALGPVLVYRVSAIIPDLEPADLVDRRATYPDDVTRYLELPFPAATDIGGEDKEAAWRALLEDAGPEKREWMGLYALNETIVGDAADPYDTTLRIEKYLRGTFDYSLYPPQSTFSSPYAAFLFDTGTGYCQHFAGAMAMLLRYNGVPARVAVGFTSGDLEDGLYTVGTNNAHAWVEVFFPSVGWVAFDPTPGRSLPTPGASSTSPGFVNPFTEEGANGGTTATSQPTRDQFPDEGAGGEGADAVGAGGAGLAWLPWVLAVVCVLIGVPLVRALWRSRGLRRGTLAQRLQTSVSLLRRHLTDHGTGITPACTTQEMFQTLEHDLEMAPTQGLVDRIEAVLFGGRPATSDDLRASEALRKQVRTRLRHRYGWVRTGLAWYGLAARHTGVDPTEATSHQG